MKELRICGYGGQGVILTGLIIGKTASLYEDLNSSLTQSFGPEARGSSCSAQVLIGEEKILYPYLIHSDILIAMSQEAYEKFIPELKEDGIVIYEEELVKPHSLPSTVRTYGIPATRLADDKLGRKMFLNIIIVGFFTSVTGLIKPANVIKVISRSVPPHTINKNIEAFNIGFEFGKNIQK